MEMVIESAEIVFWGYFKYKDHLNAFQKLYSVCCDAGGHIVCALCTIEMWMLWEKYASVWNKMSHFLGYVARWTWKADADKREFFEQLIDWTTAYACRLIYDILLRWYLLPFQFYRLSYGKDLVNSSRMRDFIKTANL